MVFRTSAISGGLFAAVVSFILPLDASAQRVIDFGDLSLPPDSFYNGSDEAGGFSSGGAFFNNQYNSTWHSWGGWSYSNVNDTVTPDWTNQYAAITGSGVTPGGTYAVAYVDTFTPSIPRMILPDGEWISNIQITNTTYAYHVMVDGDDNFGVPAFGYGDFFYLTITGLDANNTATGSLDVYLADYRSENNSLWHIVDQWLTIDLSGSFGAETRAFDFSVTASDPGVPTYFALGEVTLIPEPGTFALWAGLGLGLAAGVRRFRARGRG